MEFDEWIEKCIEIRKPTLEELKNARPSKWFPLNPLKLIYSHIDAGNDEEVKDVYDQWDGDIEYVKAVIYHYAEKGLYEELPQRKTITIINYKDFAAKDFLMNIDIFWYYRHSRYGKEDAKEDIERLKQNLNQTEISLIFSNDEITDDLIPDCHKRSLIKYGRAKSKWMPQWLKDIIQSGNADNLYSHGSLRECSVCKALNEFRTRKLGDNVILPKQNIKELLELESEKNRPEILFGLMEIECVGKNETWSCPIDKWNEFKTFMNPPSAASSTSAHDFTNKGGCYLLIKEQDFGITPPRVKVGMSEKNVIKDRICKAKDYQNAYVLSCHMLSKPVECEKELLEEFRKNFTSITSASVGSSGAETFETQSIEDAVKLFDEICFKYI